MIYSDAYLDHMGDLYTGNPWLVRVCRFEEFLIRPLRCLALAADLANTEFAARVGLLPAQRAIQLREWKFGPERSQA